MTMPAPMRAAPPVTSVRRMPAAAARAWIHEPAVQVTAAADRARPPSVTLPPRTSTTLSGTNASVPKNAKVIPNTTATTDGRPRRRRSVPGGSKCPSAAIAEPAARDGQQQRQRQAADGQRRQHQRRSDCQAQRIEGAARIAPHRYGGALRRPQARELRIDRQAHEQHRRHDPEEDPAPIERVGHPPRQRGTDQARNDPRARGQRDHARRRRGWIGAGDRRVDDGTEGPDAEALDGAPGDHHRHRVGEAGDDHAGGEQDDADRERSARTAAIGVRAGERDADDVGQPERAECPAIEIQPSEVTHRGGKHRRHRHALKRSRGDESEEPDRQQSTLGGEGSLPFAHPMTAGPSSSGEPSFAS